MFNVLNPPAARDNLLQGAADVLTALRVAGATLTVPTVGAVKFNPMKVAYFGHSQGANSGELALAFATIDTAVLSGSGAFLTDSLLTKTSPVNIAAGLQIVVGDKLDDGHPVMTLFQSYFERADGINLAPLLLRAPPMGVPSKNLFFSYGVGDTYSTEATQKKNVAALGLPLAPPGIDAMDMPTAMRPVSANISAPDGKMRTAAYFKYEPAGYDGHFVTQRNPKAIADWSAFLQSWLETGKATVP